MVSKCVANVEYVPDNTSNHLKPVGCIHNANSVHGDLNRVTLPFTIPRIPLVRLVRPMP